MRIKVERTCKSCGAAVDPKRQSCPYCGTVYDPDKIVEKEIKTRTAGYKELLWRLVAVTVLVVLIALCGVIAANPGLAYYGIRDRSNAAHAAEYRKTIQDYLDAGDYMEVASFVSYHGIGIYDDSCDGLSETLLLARQYEWFVMSLLEGVMPETPDEYSTDQTDRLADSIAEELAEFYGSYENFMEYSEDEWYRTHDRIEEQLPYFKAMEREVAGLAEVYLGFSAEDLAEFLDSSDAKQALMVEEALKNE